MVSGKDDLTKASTCGLNGTYRIHQLGFNDGVRCIGKGGGALFKQYPKVVDPFSSYLDAHSNINDGRNESEWQITYECCEQKVCCTQNGDSGHTCPVPINVHEASYQDNWITQRTLEVMDRIPDPAQPWFIQVNWAGPHPPFIILEAMNETVVDRSLPYPINGSENANDVLIARRDYVAEIENLDAAFAVIVNKVRAMGQLDKTLFCVSSDHGEMLGDFDLWAKSKPWVASSNVPLVCMGPGVEKGAIVETYVSNMDLAATFLDFGDTPLTGNMTSVSLKPFLNGTWSDASNAYREFVSSGCPTGAWRCSR